MPDLSDLKALIRDHQEKDTGLTVDVAMCMKTWLVAELAELEEQRAEAVAAGQRQAQEIAKQFQGSMASPPEISPSEIITSFDDEIAAKRAEVDAATITLHFKALTQAKYREVLRETPLGPSTSPDEDDKFFANLTQKCYRGVNWGGTEFTATDLPWADIRDQVSFGEVEPIHAEVFALNLGNKSRRPLSSTPSRLNPST